MRITFISDLHGYYPVLSGGDLLIVAGDLTARDTSSEYIKFFTWMLDQEYSKKILIAGNHDNLLELHPPTFNDYGIDYLYDSGLEYEGMKIWGSPWTKNFKGQNPECMAFGLDSDEEMAEKWDLIPDDINILITHSPPQGKLDCGYGCPMLRNRFYAHTEPLIHVFGHIHECGGIKEECENITYINASYVDQFYKPVNPIVEMEI